MNLSEFVFRIVEEMESARYPFHTTSDVESARLELCLSCEHYTEEDENCEQCGCYVPMKVKDVHGRCPVDKWSPDLKGWEKYFDRFAKKVVEKYPTAEKWTN